MSTLPYWASDDITVKFEAPAHGEDAQTHGESTQNGIFPANSEEAGGFIESEINNS